MRRDGESEHIRNGAAKNCENSLQFAAAVQLESQQLAKLFCLLLLSRLQRDYDAIVMHFSYFEIVIVP